MTLNFPNVSGSGEIYIDVMQGIVGNETSRQTMVDLGCHKSPYNSGFDFGVRRYVDIQERPLDNPKEQPFFVKADVIDYLNQLEEPFTVSIASDLIEHLTKERGFELIRLMKEKSYKQIFFTPLGEYMISEDDNPDSHRSGWMPEDFAGYATIVFPYFHKALNKGAFFAFNCENITQEFERVSNDLKNKSWAK